MPFNRLKIAVFVQHDEIRHRQTGCAPDQLGAPFIHANRRSHHTAAGIRHAHQFKRALNRAILAITPVQRNKGAVERRQITQRPFRRIERLRIDALPLQRCQYPRTAVERNIALRRAPAHQHGNLTERTHAHRLYRLLLPKMSPLGSFHSSFTKPHRPTRQPVFPVRCQSIRRPSS